MRECVNAGLPMARASAADGRSGHRICTALMDLCGSISVGRYVAEDEANLHGATAGGEAVAWDMPQPLPVNFGQRVAAEGWQGSDLYCAGGL